MDQPASALTLADPDSPSCDCEASNIVTIDPVGASLLRRLRNRQVGRSIMTSSSAQIIGRLIVALARLAVAGLIVRQYQEAVFGEYSVVFGILSIGEWLVDFGTTEVFVRDLCREPEKAHWLLRVLTLMKLVQIPAAIIALAALVIAVRYPWHIVAAALVGSANLVFFGGILIYRVVFRATLTVQKESISECVSVALMIPMVALVCHSGGGLIALIACHVLSRGIFLLGCILQGKADFQPSISGVRWTDVQILSRSCVAIGIVGFLVGGYETLDVLLLSKLSTFQQVAVYSAAQRLVWPTLMALSAIGSTFYPLIASYWPNERSEFSRSCQRALDTTLLLAGIALSSLFAGAPFYMSLLGKKLVYGSVALQILAGLAAIKAITATVGPVLYVMKAQKYALRFIAFALIVKICAMAAVAHRFGFIGVAWTAVIVETLCAAIPSVYLVQRLGHFRLRWSVALRVAASMSLAACASILLLRSGGVLTALLAPAFYVCLVFLTRAMKTSDLKPILRWRTA